MYVMKYTSLKDNLNYIRALRLAEQLSDEEKARLCRDLMGDVRRSRLERLQVGPGGSGLSDEEILAEVEYVRQIMYEERGGDENHSGYKSVD